MLLLRRDPLLHRESSVETAPVLHAHARITPKVEVLVLQQSCSYLSPLRNHSITIGGIEGSLNYQSSPVIRQNVFPVRNLAKHAAKLLSDRGRSAWMIFAHCVKDSAVAAIP